MNEPTNSLLVLQSPSTHPRSGFLIVGLLIFMVMSMALIMISLTFSLNQQRQLVRQHQSEQCRWLADAGLNRALEGLQNDPSYQGETIELSPSLGVFTSSKLKIQVLPQAGDQPPMIYVTAILKEGQGSPATHRRSIQVAVENE